MSLQYKFLSMPARSEADLEEELNRFRDLNGTPPPALVAATDADGEDAGGVHPHTGWLR